VHRSGDDNILLRRTNFDWQSLFLNLSQSLLRDEIRSDSHNAFDQIFILYQSYLAISSLNTSLIDDCLRVSISIKLLILAASSPSANLTRRSLLLNLSRSNSCRPAVRANPPHIRSLQVTIPLQNRFAARSFSIPQAITLAKPLRSQSISTTASRWTLAKPLRSESTPHRSQSWMKEIQDWKKWVETKINECEQENLTDKDLWEQFQDDFDEWTEKNFNSDVSNTLLRRLRDVLRRRGVWVSRDEKITIEKALYNTLQEKNPSKWTEKEMLRYLSYENFIFITIKILLKTNFGRKPSSSVSLRSVLSSSSSQNQSSERQSISSRFPKFFNHLNFHQHSTGTRTADYHSFLHIDNHHSYHPVHPRKVNSKNSQMTSQMNNQMNSRINNHSGNQIPHHLHQKISQQVDNQPPPLKIQSTPLPSVFRSTSPPLRIRSTPMDRQMGPSWTARWAPSWIIRWTINPTTPLVRFAHLIHPTRQTVNGTVNGTIDGTTNQACKIHQSSYSCTMRHRMNK
jgi:hypothetical protein